MAAKTDTGAPMEALRARLLAGEHVTPAEWAAAQAADQLQAEMSQAAAARAAWQQEAERQARIVDLRQTLPARLDPAPLEAARAAMAEAIRTWMATCAAYDSEIQTAREQLQDVTLAPLPADLSPDYDTFHRVLVNGVEYRPARPQTHIRAAVAAALQQHYPRRGVHVDNPQD